MAFTSNPSSSSSSNSKVQSCSKQCEQSYEQLKTLFDEQRRKLSNANIEIIGYQYVLESIEGQLRVHQQNEVIYEEKIKVLEYQVKDKSNLLKYTQKQLDKALREKDLKPKLENFEASSKNLTKLLDSQISAKVKTGLGYDSQFNEKEVLDIKEEEVTETGFENRSSDEENSLANDSETVASLTKDATKTSTACVEKPKKDRSSAPIIQDWDTESDDDSVFRPEPIPAKIDFVKAGESVKHVKPVKSITHVKPVKPVKTAEYTEHSKIFSSNPKVDRKDWNGKMIQILGLGFGFTKKACFVCGSLSHLIKDCTFHEDRMAKKFVLPTNVGKGTVFTRSGKIPVSAAKPKATASTSAAKPVNTAGPKQSGHPHQALKNKGIVDTGYFKHMTRNKAYRTNYQEINDGGFVAFGSSRECCSFWDLTCLFAKASIDESNLWHRRLGHVNFKNMNKLIKGNLVRGLPLKIFNNDHSCIACQKGKQHKATLTADFSRFSWVFFLATKDKTSKIVAEDQPYAEDASPTGQSPEYVPESDLEAHPEDDDDDDPEEDPVDYPTDGGDDGDDEEGSSEDDEDDDMDIEADEEEEEEEHPAPADSVVIASTSADQAPSAEETEPFETDESAATPPPHPAYRMTARISVLAPIPMPAWSDSEIPFLPLPPILSPPSPVLSPAPPPSPIRSLGYRAAMIRLRAEAASTSHSPPLPSPFILSPTKSDAPLSGTPLLLPISASTSSPPLQLPSGSRREDRPEVTLPPRKKLGIALGPGYEVGESSSAAAARPAGGLRADYGFREVGYGITDSWDEIVEALQGAPVSTDTELGGYMREFETRVRQDTDEIYMRLDDEQSERQLLAGRLNMLFRDRRAHTYTRHLMETEARMSREAWVRSTDASDLVRGEETDCDFRVAEGRS
nr:putative ribonuclease H-like domain-containing protein [Tanacetum cinerariifolium]